MKSTQICIWFQTWRSKLRPPCKVISLESQILFWELRLFIYLFFFPLAKGQAILVQTDCLSEFLEMCLTLGREHTCMWFKAHPYSGPWPTYKRAKAFFTEQHVSVNNRTVKMCVFPEGGEAPRNICTASAFLSNVPAFMKTGTTDFCICICFFFLFNFL